MQTALRHRGPDDAGIFLSGDGSLTTESSEQKSFVRSQSSGLADWCCGLAHTRLSILDLSLAGHQPMASPDRRFHITFNGEIYNFRELRAQLETAGETFQTHTDTEVLLRLYSLKGPECVKELAGMFAFAVWDELEESCFLARDPLGVKPLYYNETGGGLVFASELRALLEADTIPRRLSREAVEGYLLFGSVQEPQTLVEGVRELPAGGWLHWRDGRTEERRYFDVQFQPGPSGAPNAVAATRAALLDSVRRHFVSDVPVGIFLSGGMDSTALVALARLAGVVKIRTFSISFDSADLNEGDVAARTARHFGTEHHDWRLGSAEGKQLLKAYLDHVDQPSVDGFNTFCVSKWAHDNGAKVVLSGLGGDEFFGGYSTFQRVPRLFRLASARWLPGPLRTAAGNALQTVAQSPRQRRLGSFLAGPPSMTAAYWAMRGIFTTEETRRLVARYFPTHELPSDLTWMPMSLPALPTPEDQVSYLEISRYMRNQLLRDSDVMSMAWGLELRVPFVDERLAAVLAGIPAAVRLRAGKNLLHEAVPEIPEWVALRPKRGFIFPFEQWIRSEWQQVFAQLDATSPVPLATWYRRWTLFALEDFVKRHGLQR